MLQNGLMNSIKNFLKNSVCYLLFLLILLFCNESILAQKGVTTVGLQLKPILPFDALNTTAEAVDKDFLQLSILPKTGYAFGMVIRRGITEKISFETGINYVKRNYELTLKSDSLNYSEKSTFGIVGYELPLQGLVYIRWSKNLYMNNALGLSMDFLASDVRTYGSEFAHLSEKESFLKMALLANIGFEYRTKDKGYFYLGATYHRPFSDIIKTRVTYNIGNVPYNIGSNINGTYFTLDLRYFFHEKPNKSSKTNVEDW
jgi:Outer membrane protein beta-barrel domain